MREIVAENPELLFRMDYYMDAMLIDYLPIEIQNMMVLTGQGIGETAAAKCSREAACSALVAYIVLMLRL